MRKGGVRGGGLGVEPRARKKSSDTTAWLKPESTELRETDQTQKDNYCMVSPTEIPRRSILTQTESQSRGDQD